MKTIRARIRAILLLITSMALVMMGVVTILSITGIRGDVVDASNTLGVTAGTSSGAALEGQILERLTQTAATKASIADEKLGKQQNYTQMLADFAGELYSEPEKYLPHEVLPPDPSLAGTNTAQLLFAEDVDPETLQDEVDLLANSSELLLLIPNNDEDITADYIATESGLVIMIDHDSDCKPDTIDGRSRSWYRAAKEADELIWTDVFNDAMGRGLAITCAAPIHNAQGELMGVAGIGALMTNLNNEIISTTIGETGYVFVVNQKGSIIISPKIVKDDNGDFAEDNILEDDNEEIVGMVSEMLKGKSSVACVEYEGRQVYMACEPMDVLPWGVVAVIDADEALLPVRNVSESISGLTSAAIASVDNSIKNAFIAIIVVLLLITMLVLVASGVLSKKLSEPLANLTAGVEKISGGSLDTKLDIHTGDEIELLSNAFNSMTERLQKYIEDLTRVTAEKERIGAELNVATKIQASMLPCIFPAFPEHTEFDIYATMQPAKEVGGDFYDFFLVDEKHLGFVMADVSGKGIPAALFMVIAKTLIKNHAQNGECPAQVLTSVNAQLCENNDATMFVTCWIGVLDIESGRLVYGNAGHNPPLIKRAGGSFEYLKMEPGFVLAGLPTIQYKQFELDLRRGDVIYLYTDGVTEAMNAGEELFGEQRLLDTLNSAGDIEMNRLLPHVKAAIDSFVGTADQFDDITMLGLKFNSGD